MSKLEQWKNFISKKNQIFSRLANIDAEIAGKRKELMAAEKELLKREILEGEDKKLRERVNKIAIDLENLLTEKEKLKKVKDELEKIEGELKKETMEEIIKSFKMPAKAAIEKFVENLEKAEASFEEIKKVAQEADDTPRNLAIPLNIDMMLPSRILFQIDTQTVGRLIPPIDFENPRQVEMVKKKLQAKIE